MVAQASRCVPFSAPAATLSSPEQRRLLFVRRKLRVASTIPSRAIRPPALEIEAGARGHTGETPMLWTDCRAYLFAKE